MNAAFTHSHLLVFHLSLVASLPIAVQPKLEMVKTVLISIMFECCLQEYQTYYELDQPN